MSKQAGKLTAKMMGAVEGPSPQFQAVMTHFNRFAPMMLEAFFEAKPVKETPPRFVARDPIDMALVRMAMRVFPVAPQMPDGQTRLREVDIEGVDAEWIVADGANPNRRILYLHGGGYTSGDVDGYRCFIARISAASKAAVLAINYRLAPEHPFPAAIDDSIAAYRHLLANGPDGKSDASHAYIVGDSAGGGLVITTAYRLRDLALRKPDALVAMSPWGDLLQSGDTLGPHEKVGGGKQASLYYGKTDPHNPLISPLFGDATGLPPILIQAGETEGYLDDARRLAAKINDAGVDTTFEIWRSMPHVHQVHAPLLPEANLAIERIGAFLTANA